MSALRRERTTDGKSDGRSSPLSFQGTSGVRCRTPILSLAGSRVSLQSRPSPDGSSVEGVPPIEKKKKARPSSAFISTGRKKDFELNGQQKSRKSPNTRPQSAVVLSPRLNRKDTDNRSSTPSSANVFKVTVRDAKSKRSAPVPDWASELSSEISLGEKIEALARKNTTEFVEAMEDIVSDDRKPPRPTVAAEEKATEDLTLSSSFLPQSGRARFNPNSFRRKSDSALSFTTSANGKPKHMNRVQEWIEEIQALDEEERRLELKEAEAADALTVVSLEDELMATRKPGTKIDGMDSEMASIRGADACVGTDESFDDEMEGLEELIERCKRSDGLDMADTQSNNQLSDNYYSILETLELLEVRDASSDAAEFELKTKISAPLEPANYSLSSPAYDAVSRKPSPTGFRSGSGDFVREPSSGRGTRVDDIHHGSSLMASTTLDIPSRSSVASYREPSVLDGDSSGFEGRSDVAGKTSEIFALLDQHAGLEPMSKKASHKPSFNGQYAGDYIDALGKISMMELEMREKSNVIEDLKATLAEQRELLANNTKNANKELRLKLETQKKDYEETIKRHLNMIDQLIAEKRGLADRCEKLADEMKQMDKRHRDTINSIEERHAAELRRIRSVQTSAEKLKRDKWIDDKTKEIKEMTVKGLEPEIQRILERHKAELEGIRAGHKAELREVERRVKAEMNQEIERLKVDFQREKEMACMSEREIARQRLEKQFEEEEKLLQERRLKLLKQAEDEREKWERLVSKTREEAHIQLENQRQKFELEVFQLREMLAKEEEKRLREKEDMAVNSAREIEAEKARLNANFEASVDQAIKARARDLEAEKEKLVDDLRKEHLLDIEKLRNELGAEFEDKLRRIKDKYTAEMEELENQEKSIHARYFTAKSELTQVQEDLMKYKTSSSHFERQLEAVSKELECLQEERKNMWTGIGTQFEARIDSLEEDNRKLRLDLNECRELLSREKRGRENDRETLKKEKENEMEQVFKRVKFALDKKEESMSQLKREYQEVLLRNQQLQSLVEKQGSSSSNSSSANRFRKLPSRQHNGKSP